LAASHKNALLLLGKAATVTAFESQAPVCGLIHLATHGEYDPVNPLASGLLLSGAKGEKPNLTAGMVFKMELNADLVTLSGCQTALGKTTKGDEVIGLSRAFIYAGTPSVVSSLWKVADDSTALLMASFYAGLNSGDKSKALAQAQRTVMKQHPHPFHWAAFTLIGDWK
jgi:CHAT domain-containing protein